jgi:hypothetical protein
MKKRRISIAKKNLYINDKVTIHHEQVPNKNTGQLNSCQMQLLSPPKGTTRGHHQAHACTARFRTGEGQIAWPEGCQDRLR